MNRLLIAATIVGAVFLAAPAHASTRDMCRDSGVANGKLSDCVKKTDACLTRVAAKLRPDENGDINITNGTILSCMAKAGYSGADL